MTAEQSKQEYIITESQIKDIEEHGWMDAYITLDKVRSHPVPEQSEQGKLLGNLIEHCDQLVKDAKEEQNFRPKDVIDAALYIKEKLLELRDNQYKDK